MVANCDSATNMGCIAPYCLPSRASTCKGTLKVAKVQYKLRVASCLNLGWFGITKWNMEENFSMESNMEWNIFSMEWKKIIGMEYRKIVFHSIPYRYHALILTYLENIFALLLSFL